MYKGSLEGRGWLTLGDEKAGGWFTARDEKAGAGLLASLEGRA